jgi:hypothetical protein
MARPRQPKRSSPNGKAKAKRKAAAAASPRSKAAARLKEKLTQFRLIGEGWTRYLTFGDVPEVATGFSRLFATEGALLVGYVFQAVLLSPDDPPPERWVDLLCRGAAAGMAGRSAPLGTSEEKLQQYIYVLENDLREWHGHPRSGDWPVCPIAIDEVQTAAQRLPDAFLYHAGTHWLDADGWRDPCPGALAALGEMFEDPEMLVPGGSTVGFL